MTISIGAEGDEGDVLVIKSGHDFRDFSELILELEPCPVGSIRGKVIKTIRGKRHTTQPNSRSSDNMSKLLKSLLSSVSSALKAPVCKSNTEIDVRSRLIRVGESAAGNWIADIVRHAYDDSLCMKGCGGSDGVLICAGTLRGDSGYGPGLVTIGDILEILPFEDPLVVLELDGEALWGALESSLETWPAQEGRFPVISGFRVSWDSRRPPGQRVLGVWLLDHRSGGVSDLGEGVELTVDEEVKRETGGCKYNIVTREYMAQGHDGFQSLKGQRYLVGDEEGQLMSAIVRNYFLGARFVNKMLRLAEDTHTSQLRSETLNAIAREKTRKEPTKSQGQPDSKAATRWKDAMSWARSCSKRHYRDQLGVASREHMSGVDCFDGEKARAGETGLIDETDDDLISVCPVIDGRLKDEARA